jgi:hypothetical protein
MMFWFRLAAIASPATLLLFWHPTVLASPIVPSEPTPLKLASALPTLERTVNASDFDYFAQQSQPPQSSPSDSSNASKSQLTPLQLPPIRLFNLETANQLPQGAFYTNAGVRIFPKGSSSGSGLQVFHGLFEAGVTQKLQIGGHFILFDDVLGKPINGLNTNLEILGLAPQVKYQILNREKFRLGLSGSVEYLKFTTDNGTAIAGLFKPAGSPAVVTANTIAGTLQVPLTVDVAPRFQWHVTPGVAFFPGSVNNGSDFYGTFANIGTGFSWQALKRVSFFADVNVPLGPGKNAVNSDGSFYQQVVWSGGGRFLVSPAVGVDLYATNALGQTPATRLLSFIPGGSQTAVGINLVYTPDIIQGYPTSFRPRETPYSDRDYQLMLDGITLTSADTLSKGALLFDIGTNTGSATDVKIAYGISDDAQIEFLGQAFSDGSSVTFRDSRGILRDQGNSLKLGAGVKVRFLDQAKGDPISMSVKGEFADATNRKDGTGMLRAEAAFMYQVNPQVALTFNPQFAAFGPVTLAGAGLGLNADVYRGLQLIGEFTPSFKGDKSVWSAGLRYQHAKTGLGFDIYGSNGIGRHLVGSLVAEADDTNFGVNVHWLGFRRK